MSLSVFPVSLPAQSLSGQASAGAAGANGNAFAGLFAMLQQQGLSNLSQQEISLQDGSKASLLLVPSDNAISLQDALSRLGAGQNGQSPLLPEQILAALTAGTPLLPDGANAVGSTSAMQPISPGQLAELVSNRADALSNSNVLLIVAPATPSTLDELVRNISAALNQANSAETSADTASSGPNIILVTLAAPQNENLLAGSAETLAGGQEQSDSANASDIDFLLYSGLIVPLHVPANAPQSGNDMPTEQSASAVGTVADGSDELDGTQSLAPFEVSQKNVGNSSADLADAAPDHGDTTPNISGKLDLAKAEQSSAASRFMGDTNALGLNARFDAALAAAQQVASPLTNPSLNNGSAAAPHPATQTVAAQLTQAFQNGEVKSQQLSIQLDPPELGKIQVHLSLEKGEGMKIHLVADNEDTLNLLKRDIHNLRHTLDMAGIKTDDASLSFDMSNDSNAFQQAMQQQNGQNSQSRSTSFGIGVEGVGPAMASGSDHAVIDTTLGIHVDAETGTVRYNIMA